MRAVAAVLVAASVLAGCGGARPDHDLTLGEFSIVTRTPTIAADTTSLSIENAGEFAHTVVISDETGAVLASTDLIQPGTEASLPIDLAPGRYEFTCRIVLETESGIVDHYQEGMHATVTVEG